MKICLVSLGSRQSFPDIENGGAQSCVENLAQSLYYLRKDFFVICPKRKFQVRYPFEVIETSTVGDNDSFIQEVVKIAERKKPDIFLVNGFWSVEPLLKFNKPIICTVHSGIMERDDDKLVKDDLVFYRFISQNQYEKWTKTDWDRSHNIQIYTGMSDLEFSSDTKDRKNDYFLWVSSLSWPNNSKGIFDFVELAKMNPNEKFLAYGSGNKNMEKILKNLSFDIPNFGFMGHLSRPDNKKVFENAKATLFLSHLDESFGRVVLESISRGTPVFSYKIPAVMEQIDNFVCGECCEDLGEIHRKLDKKFNRREIIEFAKENFSSKKEVLEIFKFSEKILSAL